MKKEKSLRLQQSLSILRQTVIDENLQVGVNHRDNSIFFFDHEIYLQTGKFDGVIVDIQDLVK